MDYKDAVVVSLALLGGLVGASYLGGGGYLAGTVLGAGFGAAWAYRSDLREHALRESGDVSIE